MSTDSGNVMEVPEDLLATDDLRSRAAEEAEKVTDLVRRSKNLKGTFIKEIKRSVLHLQQVTNVLADRAEGTHLREALEANAQMRQELRALRAERIKATEEIVALREALNERNDGRCPPVRPRTPPSRDRAAEEEREKRLKRSFEELLIGFEGRMEARMEARFKALEKRVPTPEAPRPPPRLRTSEGTAPPTETSQLPVAEKEDTSRKESSTPSTSQTISWVKVVGRREKKNIAREAVATAKKTAAPAPTPRTARTRIRTPSSAVVVLSMPRGSEAGTMDSVMQEAKEKIVLERLEIASVRTRKGFTGSLIIEIPGTNSGEKADRLAEEIRKVAGGRATVTRPTKTAELRVTRIGETTTAAELASALSATGECEAGQLKIGQIQRSRWGTGTAWVRCPARAAAKLAAAGEIQTGWTVATVTALTPRQNRCYRCLELGHPKEECSGDIDRSGRCYRCGEEGHKAATCRRSPKCPLCTEAGRPNGHCLGAATCKPLSRKAEGRENTSELPPREEEGDDERSAPSTSAETPREDPPPTESQDA